MVSSGSGRALVCVTGEKSRRGATDKKLDTTQKTPLQTKLENLGTIFTKWGIIASMLIFVANIVNFIIKVIVVPEYRQAGLIINDLA